MNERTARRLGLVGVGLILLTIPIYFLDLLVFAPDSKPCQGEGTGSIVMAIVGIGVLSWGVGVVFSGIAISQKTSRLTGIGGVILAIVIAFVSVFALFVLTAGECVPEPAAFITLSLGLG